jgi:hypothetical protein
VLESASPSQKDYTLALAAVSQLASTAPGTSDADRLESALALLNQGISSTGMTSGTASDFHSALEGFVANANNQTGVSDTTTTSLVNAGTLTKSYTLAFQGEIPAHAIEGAQFVLALPTGVTLNLNSNDSTVLASSLALSQSVPPDALFAGKYSSGAVNIALATLKGIGSGSFATISCNIAPGSSAPPGSAFAVYDLKVIDTQENQVPGVSVTVN